MMARLLRWQAPGTIDACRKALESIVSEWLGEWLGGDVECPSLTPAAGAMTVPGMQWWQCGSEDAASFIAVPARTVSALGRRLLQSGILERSEFIDGVGSDAISDLCEKIRAAGDGADSTNGGGQVVKLLDPPGTEHLSDRFGVVEIMFDAPLEGVRVFLAADWCRGRSASPSARDFAPLATRKDALLASQVSLAARVDLGRISLAESTSLKVGEVLVTDAPTDQEISLSVGDALIASGALSRDAGQRAFLVLSVTKR